MLIKVRWLPSLICGAGIFWLSSQSVPPGANLAPDYVGHFLVYSGLTATLVWGWTNRLARRFSPWGLLVVVALSTAYGATDEFHQSFVPLRTMSGQDLLVDFLASIVTAAASYALLRTRQA